MSNDQNSTSKPHPFSSTEPSQPNPRGSTFGRRTFMKRLGLAGAAALPAGGLLMSRMGARAAAGNSQLTSGDVAILRFLAAAEILETDLWQQYTELALGNEAFQLALE